MKISARNDVSYLFSNMNSRNSSGVSGISGLLTQYSSIKTGTYGKLLKSYYAQSNDKVSSVASKNESIKKDETVKAYNKVNTNADALMKDIGTLSKIKDDATEDEVYKAVNNYVKDYNSLVDSAKDVSSQSVYSRVSAIQSSSTVNAKDLAKIGISANDDGKLVLDKEKLASAGLKDVQSLFATRGSYGASVNLSAGMAASNAKYEASKTSLYNANGAYQSSTGSLYDSLF